MLPATERDEKHNCEYEKKSEERPAPFAHKTQPYATLSVVHYGERLNAWMQRLKSEPETPTSEQFDLLRTVCNRMQFQVTKEGLDLPKKHPDRTPVDRPLLAFCHGCPGAD
jgi:hypothetical protein